MPVGPSGGAGVLHPASETLNNAQIKALPTTGIEVVAAQGSDKILLPANVIYSSTIVVAYDNLSLQSYVGIFWGDNIPAAAVVLNDDTDGFADLTVLFGLGGVGSFQAIGAGNQLLSVNAGVMAAIAGASSAFANKPLKIKASNIDGNYTEGHDDNELNVSFSYLIWNSTTQQFE